MNVEHESYEGEGSSSAPFNMRSIGQWAKAASESTREDYDLYRIGGQWIERSPPGEYGNYITALARPDKNIAAPAPAVDASANAGDEANVDADDDTIVSSVLDSVVDSVATTEQKHFRSNTGRMRLFESPSKKEKKDVYRIKYERFKKQLATVDDKELAKQARGILKGEQGMSNYPAHELPGTVGSLFLAEVSRSAPMLPVGLMLLDLIEVGACYGATRKPYTFEKMMSDSKSGSRKSSAGSRTGIPPSPTRSEKVRRPKNAISSSAQITLS